MKTNKQNQLTTEGINEVPVQIIAENIGTKKRRHVAEYLDLLFSCNVKASKME